MNYKTIFVLLSIIFSSCYKDYNPKYEDKFFLYGGIASGYSPYLRLYKTNFDSINTIKFNEYIIIVTDQNGTNEIMSNGNFNRIIGKAGMEYTIKWKHKSEQNWHEFKKSIPKDNIDFSSLKKEKNKIQVSLQTDDNLFYFLSNTEGLSRKKEINHFLLKQNTSLQIWPPTKIKYNVSPYSRSNINEQYTCEPFIWSRSFNSTKDYMFHLKLYSMSEKDKSNFIIDKNAQTNKQEPLFDNKPFIFDYSKNNQYAMVYFYNEHNSFNFKNNLDTLTGLIRYEILQDNRPINPSKIKFRGLSIWKINNIKNGYQSFDNIFLNTNNRLFFKDYIDYLYVSELLPTMGNCPSILDSYNLEISVSYDDVVTKQSLRYTFPFFYDGKTSQTLTINIP